MQNMFLQEAEKYAKQNYRRRIWRKIVRVMACAVVFCTTYALILPAITLEKTQCSLDEHTHSESCYEKVDSESIASLDCTYESLGVHVHTSDCYNGENQLSCGQADYLIHVHNADCLDENGMIVCKIPEVSAHEHTDACYRVVETEPSEIETTGAETIHSHGDDCYTAQRGELICQIPETEGHTHGQTCFTQGELVCQLTEQKGHTHGEECSEIVLVCELTVEPHLHGDGCYTQLVCDIPEGEDHTHTEECSGTVLICDMTKQPHTHTDGCYETHSLCDLPETEGHIHGVACYESLLTCELGEEAAHYHTDNCYEMVSVLVCGLEEGVAPAATEETLEAAQPELELICAEPVAQVHIHNADCYVEVAAEEDPLTCTITENHIHEAGCYDESGKLLCTLPENHTHSSICYGTWKLICTQEEHTHDLVCQNDPEADVETETDWMAIFADVTLTGEWDEDLLAIAQSQLGYQESTRNYEVMEDGETIKGYTRYGDWYGMPYGDWDAMFVSFCLNYAGVSGFPQDSSSSSWVAALRNQNMYAPASEYIPSTGDLIFFDWNSDASADHVGIVSGYFPAEDQNTAQIQCIEGDSDNAVCITTYSQTDPTILGYGLLPGKERIPEEEENPEEEYQINLDINLGPVVILTAEEKAAEKSATEGKMMFAAAPRSTTDLKDYLDSDVEVERSFFLTLTDNEHKELPKDENGNFIAEPGVPYELTLTVNSEDGFAPGAYTYQLPAGLTVQGGSGDLVTDKNVKLGTWSIDENGLITLVFNQDANTHTKVKLSAQMGIQFKETTTRVEFDCEINVVIKKPPEEEEIEIQMAKWGGSDNGTSITWQVRVVGHEGAKIAGTLVTDTITSGNHSYTDQNRQNTIVVNASGGQGVWHKWTVKVDDPNLKYWTDTGWQYQMPETVVCEHCGQRITLADDWTYDFYYTSTPEASDTNGTVHYTNRAEFGEYEKEGIAQIKYGTGPMGVQKTGSFQGDEEGGKFVWTVKVQLPGMSAGQKAVHNWRLTDGMNVKDANGTEPDGEKVLKPHNDMDLSVVTITRNGVTTTLNRIENATDADEIVWDSDEIGWNGEIQWIEFYCRCHCTEATCANWKNGKCDDVDSNGFCLCWTIQDDVEIVFTYETDAKDIIEYYGENAKLITNLAELWYGPYWQAGYDAEVKIPSLFEKTLTDDFGTNDPNHPEKRYIASYTITLNEAKQNLSPDGTPITIVDEMTDSLVYIAGSMVITEEALNGETKVLTYGTDYTLTYDGSDRADNMHVLTIELKNPQQAMYTLKYDTSINIKGNITEAPSYQNWAKVTIWGKNLTADTDKLLYTDINFAAKTYQVDIVKTADGTNALLPGATFGLYNEAGGLIVSQTTDENGELTFVTSITDGIILLEHIPYYIQEIEAPEGYMLDTTKYWFYFCDQEDGCTEGSGIKEQHPNAVRIPGNKIHTFELKNTMYYELPETGGTGNQMYTMAGLLLMLISAAYLMYSNYFRRREEL